MEDAIEGDCSYSSIYLNTVRAEKLGIQTGDWVEVECIGPRKKDDSCVLKETAIGRKERARARVTEGLHPSAAWVYFASGHKSSSMLPKVREGVTYNWLMPLSVSPYAAGTSKNYSIVRISKVDEGK
jgi:anaerobic selenocysteine-containing dehydrogenase